MSNTIEELYQTNEELFRVNEELFRVNTELYQAYEEAKDQVNDQHESIEELKKAIDRKQTELVNWSERVRKISRKNYQRDNEIAELKTERSEIAHHCCEQREAIRTLKKNNRELEEQLRGASEIIRELEAVKNDEIDGLKADLEHAMVYLEGHQGREQKLKKIIRDITSDYLDILSDKDRVIEELNQLVKDLS